MTLDEWNGLQAQVARDMEAGYEADQDDSEDDPDEVLT
jgi:hypothetical protein